MYLKKVAEKMPDVGKKMEYMLNTGNLVSKSGLDMSQSTGFTVVAEKLNFFRWASHLELYSPQLKPLFISLNGDEWMLFIHSPPWRCVHHTFPLHCMGPYASCQSSLVRHSHFHAPSTRL